MADALEALLADADRASITEKEGFRKSLRLSI